MSKEMTPKEALQMIKDNLTPRILGILPVEFHIVKEALDRLEQLEIADRNNQNLVKTNVELVNKNLELQKENQALRDKLNSQDLDIWQLHCKYAKYKKVIEIIKNKRVNFDIFMNCRDLEEYNGAIEYTYKSQSENYTLTQQEYDLLKEVLE